MRESQTSNDVPIEVLLYHIDFSMMCISLLLEEYSRMDLETSLPLRVKKIYIINDVETSVGDEVRFNEFD